MSREIEDLQEEKNDLAAGWIAADKTIATQQARIDELEAELATAQAFAHFVELERDKLRDLVKKSQDEVVSFVPMLVELAELREAVLAYVGPVNDPHIGWRGSSPSHNDLFQCEACGAEDADTRAMQHTDNCTAAALLATIGQKP